MEETGYIASFMPLWEGWELDEQLGSGSFGTVWRVTRQTDAGKETAAIKEVIVPPEQVGTIETACLQGLTPEQARVYFAGALQGTVAEADMQHSLLECPYIVRFREYQVRTLEGTDAFGWAVYILMDEVQVLTEYLLEGKMTVTQIIKLGIHLCHALECCQTAGIVHRDIKPENIFYCAREDRFQLGDFGIAHYLDRPTASKGKPGTLTHMSPEVHQGKDFDYTDDLYAMGMVLYKLLNFNRVPLLPNFPAQYLPQDRDHALLSRLKGATLPLPAMAKRKAEPIGELPSLRGSVRFGEADLELLSRLGSIVQKAVAATQAERFKDAAELRAALEALSIKFG